METYGKIGIIGFFRKLMQTKKGWIQIYERVDLTKQDFAEDEE